MKRKKAKPVDRPVFGSIRKPTAPPTRKHETDKNVRKRLPSLRKAKYKKVEVDDQGG